MVATGLVPRFHLRRRALIHIWSTGGAKDPPLLGSLIDGDAQLEDS